MSPRDIDSREALPGGYIDGKEETETPFHQGGGAFAGVNEVGPFEEKIEVEERSGCLI